MGPKGRKSAKSPPIFSHEFIIQNHEDIVSCIAMVFIVGLMFQVTSPFATKFIALQHNVTIENENEPPVFLYTNGIQDLCVIFFYFLICIVIHAIVQEFVIDKINKKMHRSKTRHSRFTESGQLLVFYLTSVAWGGHIIFRENILTNISSLWENYPEGHTQMAFMYKFFFITQISYWLHTFPELYFQKVRKEDWPARIQYAVLYLVFITTAYVTNLTRVALVLLVIHYTVEAVVHASRLLHFADKTEMAAKGFLLFNVLFTLARLSTIVLSVLTFWFGLARSENPGLDLATGNFNTYLVRVNCLAGICLLQAWMMWHFITYHLRRMREQAALKPAPKKAAPAKKDKKPKEKKT
ncbi:translocating chain-associated membrane protein 1-like isoform X2 [Amphibalanus amphitrite]|uniref:translocating chain-associated membrane protein 1-like isoform X2 n=1 Tax=Amphibalanus amphitrite TaxID=1232801 RepID=UPI001C911870|nr:translocating chain-associated membrane protein 1-like isoform X2 [Amphibalanus amphitrite]XP_043237524.1 translocating chain-associated membrane protein 1-like isoform X2 [Amphibalanus amphitrite]